MNTVLVLCIVQVLQSCLPVLARRSLSSARSFCNFLTGDKFFVWARQKGLLTVGSWRRCCTGNFPKCRLFFVNDKQSRFLVVVWSPMAFEFLPPHCTCWTTSSLPAWSVDLTLFGLLGATSTSVQNNGLSVVSSVT